MYQPLRQQQGFTLIEMMIVVSVIAILAFIAVPSYQNQIRASNRADAQGALMNFAQAMERHYTEIGSYTGAAASYGPNKHYDLKVSISNPTSYTLEATPKGGMQKNDGRLTLSSTGVRLWDKNGNGTPGTPW